MRESLGILLSNNFLIAEKTLLVEGPSDVIYLLAAIRTLKNAKRLDIDLNDLSIVDAGDSQNYLAMAKIMIAEGREIVALLDGDDSGKRIESQLKKVCESALASKKLRIHMLPDNKSSENIFSDLDTLRTAAHKAYEFLVGNELRQQKAQFNLDNLQKIAPAGNETLGRILDEQTKSWFEPEEKISKLLIAQLYEDLGEASQAQPPQDSMPQLENIKGLLNLRGEKSEQAGILVDTDEA